MRSGDDLPALDDPNQNGNDGQDQQDMDEPTQGIGSNKAQEPQDEQYRKDRPKHVELLLFPSKGFEVEAIELNRVD